jgi:hypothetical protein
MFKGSSKTTFHYLMKTDGVGVSLIFARRADPASRKRKRSKNVQTTDVPRLSEVTNLASFRGKNIVGADPGKFNLVYLADGRGNLRYTAHQRSAETRNKRNCRILLQEKRKHNVHDAERELAKHDCKTVDYERFKDYIRAKTRMNQQRFAFYERELFRKLKWRQFTYTQRSEVP